MSQTQEASQEFDHKRKDIGPEGSTCDRSNTMVPLPRKEKKRRGFEIQLLSDEEEEETIKKRRIETIRQWSDDDADEEDVINLANNNGEDEGLEDNRSSPRKGTQESTRSKEKEDGTGVLCIVSGCH